MSFTPKIIILTNTFTFRDKAILDNYCSHDRLLKIQGAPQAGADPL